MGRTVRYYQKYTKDGWPLFTANQTDIRIALCRKALCIDRSLRIKFKDCYESDSAIVRHCKLKFLYGEYFTCNLSKINELGWGGVFKTPSQALEGAFYPFVRYIHGSKPIDTGCIWIGTKHEYPRIYVDNMVADWLCPYSKMGYVMTEPFEPLYRVIQNWRRLANRRLYPGLLLPPVPDL